MANGLKPKFDFDEVEKWLVRGTLLFVGLLMLLCIVKKLLVYHGFLVSFEHVFVSVSNIVAAWAWPCCVLFIIYLFKDGLGELADVIGRIYKGKDYMMSPSKRPDSSDDEFGDNATDGTESGDRRKAPMELLNERLKDIVVFKSHVLSSLQREEQVLVFRNVRLFGVGDFDGAFRTRDAVCGVKVMWNPTLGTLERCMKDCNRIYHSLTDLQKSMFSVMLCVNSGGEVSNDSVGRIREKGMYTAPIRCREFSFDPNKIIKEARKQ